MLYKSTRGAERGVSFEDALLSAYATDGGLYVPEHLPCFELEQLRAWASLSYPQVCARVLSLFSGLSVEQCDGMTARAFAGWNGGGANPPLPLRRVGGRLLLETGEGPTFAFKDIGQQVVAQLLNHFLGSKGRHANVLVETSGDTGPAAVEGVRGCDHVDIFCLYPAGRVSPVQELQLITVDAPNVHVYRTAGDTDEQATMLKKIFMDKAFVAAHNVVSINSINWARIASQSSYYVWAYLQACPTCTEPVTFFVPTGAFGNGMGGFLAKRMGLPIGRIVCATNANDIVHRTLASGDMSMGTNVATESPAMDIQFAYNLERVLFYICNENPATLGAYMAQLEASGAVQLDPLVVGRLRETFSSAAVSDEETLATMAGYWRDHGYMLCPHSAIGVRAAERLALPGKQICVLTAHPCKFEDAVFKATGRKPHFPPAVQKMKTMPHKFKWLKDDAPVGVDKLEHWKATLVADVVARAQQVDRSKAKSKSKSKL
jgi:threonine synthase